MNGHILETRSKVSECNRRLESLKGTSPLDAKAILAAQVELESYEDGLTRLQKLKEELF